MSLKTLSFKALLTIVIAASVYGIYLGGRWIMGDVNAYPARYVIERWEKSQNLPEPAEIDDVIARLNTAIEWEPRNSEYHELHGILLHAKGISTIQAGETYPVELFQSAVQAHREALALRPTWPYSWGNLALMKAYAGEFDAEQSEAILKANKYGPWELPVQVTLVRAGLMSWTTLSYTDRLIIAANVQKGLRLYRKNEITKLIKEFERTEEICALIPADKNSQRLCGKRG